MSKTLTALLLLTQVWSYVNANPYKINQKIAKLHLAYKDVSIIVQGVNDSKPIVSINPKTLRTPASVIKILTTYASLLQLGSNYRWQTKIYITGKLSAGVLHGDLIIKGFGNPNLRTEDLYKIVTAIREKGVIDIKGNLIIDQSHFKVSSNNWTNFDKHTYNPYNATPNAFMFNHHATSLKIKGNKAKNRVAVYRDFPDYSYSIINKIIPMRKKCRGRYANPRVAIKKNSAGRVIVTFSGKYSSRCGTRKIYKVLTSATRTFYAAIKQKIQQQGGSLTGRLILNKIPSNCRLIHIHKSEQLINIITKINKKSNNVMAKQTLLTLGSQVGGKPSTIKAGAKAVKRILGQHNLIASNTKIINGSGLSRKAKVSADSLVKLLKHGYNSDYKWLNTLSIIGKDGTLKNRLKWTKVKNHAWMKTGSLDKVRTIAGYVRSKSGKTYIVVMLVNSNYARFSGLALQDYLIKWVYG